MQPELELHQERFAIDTSSFMAINEHFQGSEREAVWQQVHRLIAGGRIKTTRLVMQELRRNDDDAYRRLAPRLRALVVSDQDLALVAGRIARQFPKRWWHSARCAA
jgi:hypothetical protein